MNHYCTYFDQRYLAQGVALWQSLRRHDPGMVLWVLALDEATVLALAALRADDFRLLTATELEQADVELAHSRATRSALEHLFTFSPCLPRHLLRSHPEIATLTYVDADIWFFGSIDAMHAEWADGSIYLTRHDLPECLKERDARYGKFNVGILGFRNDAAGLACLDWWRERCLEWCKDVPEPGRYADQKYLDQWPERFERVVVSNNPGVNAAPWNWIRRRLDVGNGELRVSGLPLIAFHFAQLRRLSPRLIDTNQAEYGVIPFRLRVPLYGRYLAALDEAERLLIAAGVWPGGSAVRPRSVGGLKRWAFAFAFGTVWVRVGRWWCSLGLGLGRHSGRVLAWQRLCRGKPA